MNISTGADVLLAAARAAGINTCFANPGTTELDTVSALDKVEGIRALLCLFEGVCTGAADGYARMTRTPALTLLHMGPGLANGLANLHNARRAHSPMVNIIGDHPARHLPYDAPLTTDIRSLATPMSDWVKTVQHANDLADDMSQAINTALQPPGQVVSLIVPADIQHAGTPSMSPLTLTRPAYENVDTKTVERTAGRLQDQSTGAKVMLLGGNALTGQAQVTAAAIARQTGAEVFAETFPARIERGGDIPDIPRLPYFPEQVLEILNGKELILIGAPAPVSYFGYEGVPSQLVAPDKLHSLATISQDCGTALGMLADSLGIKTQSPSSSNADKQVNQVSDKSLTPASAMRVVAAGLPAWAVVVTEGAACSMAFYTAAAHAAPHTVITNTGGAIGQGPACAIGAAIACPDRRVINIQSDGGAQYTIQSLWTQAREQLNIVTVLCANRRYGILQTELQRGGFSPLGPRAKSLTTLDRPDIDWRSLARGYGVPAHLATDVAELDTLFTQALEVTGPVLIELRLN